MYSSHNSDQSELRATSSLSEQMESHVRSDEESIDSSSSCINVYFESEDDESHPFVPSIDVKVMGEFLVINTEALYNVAPASELFRILEQEKLDIVSESHHRSDDKVAHTIQVRVKAGYEVDVLVKKLCKWASGS